MGHGVADGLHPIRLHNIGGLRPRQSWQDLGDDELRVLGAGVVGGDDHKVRQPGGDCAHLGPFAPVPVAAAAEEDTLPPLGKVPDGGQHVLDGVGGDGVVDQDGVVPGYRHHLYPALDPGAGLQRLCALRQGHAQRAGRGQYAQCVVYREAPRYAHADGNALRAAYRVEAYAVHGQTDVFAPQVSLRLSEGGQGAGRVLCQPGGPGIVGVVYALFALPEEQGLGVAVGLHGPVKVQVILTQVRKEPHGEPDVRHPLQAEGVGGDLHDHVGASRVRHGPEEGLELEGFRRGALGVEDFVPDHILVGPDKAHLGPQAFFQNILQQVRCRRLPVGAGDAHHGHGGGGVAEPVPAQPGQGGAAVGYQHAGSVSLRLCLAEDAGRALFPRHGDEPVSVGLIAGDRHEQVPRLCLPGVVADAGDLQLRVRPQLGNIDALQ